MVDIIGPAVRDVWVSLKDILLFFTAYTIFIFVIGQWYTLYFVRVGPPASEVWWYPLYLLIFVLLAKIVADIFIKPAEKKKK